MKSGLGMVRDPGNDVSQPCVRIDAVEATRLNQRVDGGSAVTAAIRATEVLSFTSQ